MPKGNKIIDQSVANIGNILIMVFESSFLSKCRLHPTQPTHTFRYVHANISPGNCGIRGIFALPVWPVVIGSRRSKANVLFVRLYRQGIDQIRSSSAPHTSACANAHESVCVSFSLSRVSRALRVWFGLGFMGSRARATVSGCSPDAVGRTSARVAQNAQHDAEQSNV